VLWTHAGDFPGAGDVVHRSAAQQLQQQVSPATAPAIMALARQQDNKALQVSAGSFPAAAALCWGLMTEPPLLSSPWRILGRVDFF
jgi:hypothetical protein